MTNSISEAGTALVSVFDVAALVPDEDPVDTTEVTVEMVATLALSLWLPVDVRTLTWFLETGTDSDVLISLVTTDTLEASVPVGNGTEKVPLSASSSGRFSLHSRKFGLSSESSVSVVAGGLFVCCSGSATFLSGVPLTSSASSVAVCNGFTALFDFFGGTAISDSGLFSVVLFLELASTGGCVEVDACCLREGIGGVEVDAFLMITCLCCSCLMFLIPAISISASGPGLLIPSAMEVGGGGPWS